MGLRFALPLMAERESRGPITELRTSPRTRYVLSLALHAYVLLSYANPTKARRSNMSMRAPKIVIDDVGEIDDAAGTHYETVLTSKEIIDLIDNDLALLWKPDSLEHIEQLHAAQQRRDNVFQHHASAITQV
jgi:hypothetical protein